MFEIEEESRTILVKDGICTVQNVYSWKSKIFASWGDGYVRLKADSTTSCSSVRLAYLYTEKQVYYDQKLRLCFSDEEDKKKLEKTWFEKG